MVEFGRRTTRISGAIVLALVTSGSGACGKDCGNVDCGAPFAITWASGDVPDGSVYEVCIDETCDETQQPQPNGPGTLSLYPGVGVSDGVARLRILDASGEELAIHEGEADFSGGCCSSARMRVAPNGALVEDD
jgi:hypothetical protein